MAATHETAPAAHKRKAAARRESPRAQRARIEAAFSNRGLGGYAAVAAFIFVWSIAIAYYVLTPPVYISRWSLILPAANSSSTVTLDTIGQASNNPGQPFGSVQLSPKVIYREIATSDQVRGIAARSMGMSPDRFGRARVRLIDETSLINFQINGHSAQDAQAKAHALIQAFQGQLDVLRRDELDRRATMMRENLKIYQANLDRSRERIIEFQTSSGLLSINQFNEASSSAEQMRRRLSEKRAELDKARAELGRLKSRVGFEPKAAAAGLRLAADTTFLRLANAFAETSATVHETTLRYGPKHPARQLAALKLDGLFQEITRFAAAAGIEPGIDLRQLALFVGGAQQGDVLRSIVQSEAQVSGLSSEIEELEAANRRLEADVRRMGLDAARLEALKKDHLVTEAVFTSAAARLDTNRTDLFSSYPLVQVLADPDLPERRSQPRLIYTLAAGLLGTLIILFAMGAAWVRNRFIRTRSKSA